MRRYIDADKLHDDLTKIRINLMQEGVDVTPIWQALDCVRQQPTADVRENIKGEWIPHDLENGEKSIDEDCCSVCGERFREIAMTGCEWNYCPNCGADMRGKA